MKKMSKLLALALALVMVMSLAATAFADDPTYTITVNGKEGEIYTAYEIFNVTYSGEDANGNPTAYNYYISTSSPWFDVIKANAADVDLTLTEDPNNSSTFAVTAGTDFNAVALAALLRDKIPADAVVAATGEITVDTSDNDDEGTITLDVSNSGAGYYFVTTTLGTICILNTTTPSVEVTEKNSVPVSNKNITDVSAGVVETGGDRAIAQLGATVTFTGDFDIADGTINYAYHDNMTDGLKFNKDSVSVKVVLHNNETTIPAVDGTTVNWKLAVDEDDANKFTITFADSFIQKQDSAATVHIIYDAVVVNGELHTTPETNEAYVSYGNDGETTRSKVEVWNATIAVSKTDGTNPLAGAGFILAKTNAQGTITGYYKRENNAVSWVDEAADASEYITNDAGELTEKVTENGTEKVVKTAFTGLTNGTYILIEKTVPAGYTRAANTTVTIHDDTYSAANLSQTVNVVNQSGSVLPSTGGMGTTMLYAFGGMLVVAALVLLITKKRMAAKN